MKLNEKMLQFMKELLEDNPNMTVAEFSQIVVAQKS